MPLDKSLVTQALRTITDPSSGQPVLIAHVATCDGVVSLRIQTGAEQPKPALESLAARCAQVISTAARGQGASLVGLTVEFVDPAGRVVHTSRNPGAAAADSGHRPIGGLASAGPLPDVKHVIAVGAGKGGVGKSTISVNLAVGLARRGHAVGLLDGDIYGPSMPTMLGLQSVEQSVRGGMLQPFYTHGIKAITIGKLVDPDKPLIWRGPMAHGAFKQLTEQTEWGELDYLIIDLPPGTGDVSLTMAQSLRLTGAVVVCTPQKVAQDDAVRAAKMFQQLQIEVLGVVENMSSFIADDLNPPREYDLFGKGGAEKMAARLGLPFLGAVPITVALRENSDEGEPTRNFKSGTALCRALETLVDNVERQASLAAIRTGKARPTLTIS